LAITSTKFTLPIWQKSPGSNSKLVVKKPLSPSTSAQSSTMTHLVLVPILFQAKQSKK
jgi:hypothetical protein